MEFANPLTFDNIPDLLLSILSALVVMAVPVIVFFLIYSGFMYVTAQGNPEKIKQASLALTYGIIGGVIILGSWAITAIVRNVVDAF